MEKAMTSFHGFWQNTALSTTRRKTTTGKRTLGLTQIAQQAGSTNHHLAHLHHASLPDPGQMSFSPAHAESAGDAPQPASPERVARRWLSPAPHLQPRTRLGYAHQNVQDQHQSLPLPESILLPTMDDYPLLHFSQKPTTTFIDHSISLCSESAVAMHSRVFSSGRSPRHQKIQMAISLPCWQHKRYANRPGRPLQ